MFSKMVSMARSEGEKAEAVAEMMAPPSPSKMPDFPYGLCITLTEDELEKLDIEDDGIEIGDTIDLRAFAKVTSISKRQEGGRECCRVELQIEQLAVEDEDHEKSGE